MPVKKLMKSLPLLVAFAGLVACGGNRRAQSSGMVLKRVIRPALIEAGIVGKVVGWHTFRHSLATNLRSMGVDVKVAQELLRHANSRITMDYYTQAVSEDKRLASGRQIEMLMGEKRGAGSTQHPLAPSEVLPRFASAHNPQIVLGEMVGTSGFEPLTSTVSR